MNLENPGSDTTVMLTPLIQGETAIRSSIGDFLRAFRQRVEAGLMTGKAHPRSKYQVIEEAPASLRVRAADFSTAIAVGLNDLQLRLPQAGTLEYEVRFWRWAGYSIGLSASLGLIGLMMLLTVDVREYIGTHPTARLPGLSVDYSVTIAWAMVLFFGFIFPWVLIGIHKRPLHRLVLRLIAEVDAHATET